MRKFREQKSRKKIVRKFREQESRKEIMQDFREQDILQRRICAGVITFMNFYIIRRKRILNGRSPGTGGASRWKA